MPVTLSVIHAVKPKTLSKGFVIENGCLSKVPGGQLIEGLCTKTTVDLHGLRDLLMGMGAHQALTFGCPDQDKVKVVTKEQQAKSPKTVARSKDFFHWPDGAGIMMLDYDPQAGTTPLTRDELLDVIYRTAPGIQNAPHLWCASASSCIFMGETEQRGIMGQRVYVFVQNARDIPRAGSTLYRRLWLAGHGRFDLSKAGALLNRTIIDESVFQPERLDFAGGAICGPGVSQRRPEPIVFSDDSDYLDTRNAIPDLSFEELKTLEDMQRESARAIKPERDQVREKWIETRIQETEGKIDRDTLRRAVMEKRLLGDFQLQTEKHGVLTVGQILDNPKKYHGIKCHDPLEPDYGGNDPRIGWIKLRSAGRPYLWSFAHGGVRYTLHRTLSTVRIEGGELPNICRKILDVMRIDGAVFERGGELVRLAEGKIYPVTSDWLRIYITGLVRLEKFDGRKNEYVPKDCTPELAKGVMALAGDWNLPKLTGIITQPIICPDGRVIDEDGHDEKTGLYLEFANEHEWKGIPRKPNVQEALATLWEPFKAFPFVDEISRSVMLSAILTAVTRKIIPTAPGFLFTAPNAGSGKTILALCLAILMGDGQEVYSKPDEDEEMRKLLLAICRENHGSLIFDNVSGAIQSDCLCTFLTSERMKGRILGSTQEISVSTNTLLILTGNNVQPMGDLNRRVLRAHIDPHMEQPWDRTFDLSPTHYCQEHRLEMVRAAITILRAFVDTQKTRSSRGRLASFEAWSDFIRGCVCWIGESGLMDVVDPVKSIVANFKEDRETTKLRSLLEAWYETAPGGATVAQMKRMAERDPDLKEILLRVAGDARGESINSHRLGCWIEGREGRLIGGKAFYRNGLGRDMGILWTVEVQNADFADFADTFSPSYTKNADDISIYKGGKNPANLAKSAFCGACSYYIKNAQNGGIKGFCGIETSIGGHKVCRADEKGCERFNA